MQRRDFLMSSAALGTAMGLYPTLSPVSATAAEPVRGGSEKGRLRMCSQVRSWLPGKTPEEKMAWMKANGFEAVEVPRLGDDYMIWKKRADDTGLEISAVCIGSFGNKPVSEDEAERKTGFEEMKIQLERAGAIGARGIVYVPETKTPARPFPRIRELTIAMLRELGPFAAEHKTNIILEPLRRNEAWFLRQVADAAQIVKDAGVPGVGVLGDTYHMYTEEPDDMAAFIAGGAFLKHVHLGNGTKRQLPGQDDHCHIKAMRGLKYIGYTGFCSYECGCAGGDAAGAVEVPKSVAYLQKCWEEA